MRPTSLAAETYAVRHTCGRQRRACRRDAGARISVEGVRFRGLRDALARGSESCETTHVPKPAVDINQLTPEERLDLIERLWDSLSDDDVPLSDAQREELDRRLDALDREGPAGVPWEQVYEELGKSK